MQRKRPPAGAKQRLPSSRRHQGRPGGSKSCFPKQSPHLKWMGFISSPFRAQRTASAADISENSVELTTVRRTQMCVCLNSVRTHAACLSAFKMVRRWPALLGKVVAHMDASLSTLGSPWATLSLLHFGVGYISCDTVVALLDLSVWTSNWPQLSLIPKHPTLKAWSRSCLLPAPVTTSWAPSVQSLLVGIVSGLLSTEQRQLP